tara:strand:- start:572 stop:847 length:276 start_codon:yes stop_codon:yes gene_type:complete
MFKNVLESSQTFKSNNHIVFRYQKQAEPFIGFIVNKKFGNAIKRNRFKNQARNLYTNFFKNSHCAIIVRPLKPEVQYTDLKKSFLELENKI